jgi:hypothetical protein
MVTGADLAALVAVPGVEVAEFGPAQGAAAFGFLAHLVADVGAVLGGAVLVERGEDAVHELPDWGLVDAFGGRDQGGAVLAQGCQDQGVVEAVAVHPGQLVDDHVGDVPVGVDAFEHGLERGPFVHAGRGLAGLDVLLDHPGTEVGGLAQTGRPLGGDGDAFGVVVGLDLVGCADPQVQHRGRLTGLGVVGMGSGVHGRPPRCGDRLSGRTRCVGPAGKGWSGASLQVISGITWGFVWASSELWSYRGSAC